MFARPSVLVTLALAALAAPSRADDYALRDGDVVAFFGDSITAARTYGKIVENYTLLRFPDRKVRFFNAGWGGDTTERGLARLDRDVLDRGATVVILSFGINDIGWGTKADEEHRRRHLDALRAIVLRCRERGARAFVATAAITAEDPDTAEHEFLQKLGDDDLALARELGAGAIDLQRSMRQAQRRAIEAARGEQAEARAKGKVDVSKVGPRLHADDGIHLSDLGQLAMAYGILKGLGAPAEVSTAGVDAGAEGGPKVVEASGCRVSGLRGGPEGVEFDRLDDGLPINFGTFGVLQFRFVPVHEGLNGYFLRVNGLTPGRYSIEVDGRGLGTSSAEELARGTNIASSTADPWEPGGPWDAAAGALIRLTDARSELAEADRLVRQTLGGRAPFREGAVDADARIVALQRELVRSRPFRFVVRKAAGAK